MDINWLDKFQRRDINLFPGDSIKALVFVEVKLGDKNMVVAEHYSVIKVLDIIKTLISEQQTFIE
jgi:hypothetical protein